MVLLGIWSEYSSGNDTTGEGAVRRTNLFELLGRPVAAVASDRGTLYTDSPETYDDAGMLPSIADCGTFVTTTAVETFDDDFVLPSVADCGTLHTRDAMETYDDDSVLPSVADYGTVNSRGDWETYDDDSVLPLM